MIEQSVQQTIRLLERQIEKLRRAAMDVIERDIELTERFELLLSVKGIAGVSAMSILSELALLPADMTPRQWVAHAGLDPRLCESGTSVHKRARISKAGNAYLRASLYLPAMTAGQFDSHVAAFKEKLLRRGKATRQDRTGTGAGR